MSMVNETLNVNKLNFLMIAKENLYHTYYLWTTE